MLKNMQKNEITVLLNNYFTELKKKMKNLRGKMMEPLQASFLEESFISAASDAIEIIESSKKSAKKSAKKNSNDDNVKKIAQCIELNETLQNELESIEKILTRSQQLYDSVKNNLASEIQKELIFFLMQKKCFDLTLEYRVKLCGALTGRYIKNNEPSSSENKKKTGNVKIKKKADSNVKIKKETDSQNNAPRMV